MLEAMAAGTPVIAADVSGVRTALGADEDGSSAGWIVPPDDADALAAGLREVATLLRDDRGASRRARRRRCGASASGSGWSGWWRSASRARRRRADDGGRITLDGVDLRDLRLAELRRLLGAHGAGDRAPPLHRVAGGHHRGDGAGRIVERGTHDELLARGGVYRRLCDLQFAAGDEPGLAAGALPAGG